MFRGNQTARIDPKGRLKIPGQFRRVLEANSVTDFYVTSVTGECAQIYPMSEWEKIESGLHKIPAMNPARKKFVARTSYHGMEATIDGQGRILIHPLLRKKAGLVGEVTVIGNLGYLEVWEHEKFQARLDENPYSEDDEAAIAEVLQAISERG